MKLYLQMILRSFVCDKAGCNFRSSDMRLAAGVSSHGSRVSLKVRVDTESIFDLEQVVSLEDLNRDVLSVRIPEVDFEAQGGPNSGKCVSVREIVEGFIYDLQRNQQGGESVQEFLPTLQALLATDPETRALSTQWTLEIDDPLSNSFVGPHVGAATVAIDAHLTVERYERSERQNDTVKRFLDPEEIVSFLESLSQ